MNKLWHYEKAEKKRAVFYDELVEESKQWKVWRDQKLAEKASEPDDETATEDDEEGEDIELVQRKEIDTPKNAEPARKLRRHSDVDDQEQTTDDDPFVTSRRANQNTVLQQGKPSKATKVSVVIPSPNRQRMSAPQESFKHEDEAMSLEDSFELPEPLQQSTPKSASTALQQHLSKKEVDVDVLREIQSKLDSVSRQSSSFFPRGEANTPMIGHALAEPLQAGKAPSPTIEDSSGSEDSSAEVTDDEVNRTKPSNEPPGTGPVNVARPNSPPEDSFYSEMIAPVDISQATASRHSNAAEHDSMDDFKPQTALYTIQRPDHSQKSAHKRTATPPGASVDEPYDGIVGIDPEVEEKVQAAINEKQPQRKRQLSVQEVEADIKKTLGNKSPERKRQRAAPNGTETFPVSVAETASTRPSQIHESRRGNQPSYNTRRTIPQSPSPGPLPDTSAASGGPTRTAVPGQSNPNDTIVLSDDDEDEPAKAASELPFQPQTIASSSKPVSAHGGRITEKLARPTSRR